MFPGERIRPGESPPGSCRSVPLENSVRGNAYTLRASVKAHTKA
jgi:hypothetical protein